jgi:hypothetical protein
VDKKALYMGYANIPMALGWGYSSCAGGPIYERAGEKAGLARRYMSDVLMVKELPERTQAFNKLTEMLGQNPVEVTQLCGISMVPAALGRPLPSPGS